ncbi:MAG: DUF4347 domain-containing protein, partial [Rhodospirillaceae bacterium]|nr:DUF4347 domain-containing protein [Rhodospirillaceae bacterium]
MRPVDPILKTPREAGRPSLRWQGSGRDGGRTLLALEPRIMFDGAGMISANDADSSDDSTDDQSGQTDGSTEKQPFSAMFDNYVPPVDNPFEKAAAREVVYVDTGVANYQSLIADIPVTASIVLLDANQDAVAQISADLAGRQDLDAIHIVSHGDAGLLAFSSGNLDLAALNQRADEIAGWSASLDQDADILIYGCDIGAGAIGDTFVDQLAVLTDADIAASTNDTGATALGGDWVLEKIVGAVEVTGLSSDTFADVLAIADNGEFQVNTYTTSYQYAPATASLPDGGFVITWHSDGQDGSNPGIFAQRYDGVGTKVGVEFQVNTYTTNAQTNPSITALKDGGFVIDWQSFGQDGMQDGIYAQRYNASAATVGSEFRANSFTSDPQNRASVAQLNNGGFIITWHSELQDGTTGSVFGQRYDAAGTTAGGEFRINSHFTNDQNYPAVTDLNDGGFLVTWSSNLQDGSGWGIFAQRYDAAGATSGSEFRINTTTVGGQIYSAIAKLNDGNLIVTWSSSGQDGSENGVYGQRIDSAGTKIGTEFLVNTTTSLSQDNSSVTALADGGFLVTWDQSLSIGVDGYNIYAQRYDDTGVKVGSEFQVETGAFAQNLPSVAGLTDGSYVISWISAGQDGDSSGIFAKRYSPVANTASATAGATVEEIQSTSGLVFSRNASDNAEVTHVRITNIANGALFQNNGTTKILSGDFITFAQASAGLKFTPTGHADGSFDFQASTSNVGAGLGGSVVTSTVAVTPVADTPSVINASAVEGAQNDGGLRIVRNAQDGSEVTHIQISKISGGTLYLNDGATVVSNGAFITFQQADAGLKFTPSGPGNGSFNVQAAINNGVGGLGGGIATAVINVTAAPEPTPEPVVITTDESTNGEPDRATAFIPPPIIAPPPGALVFGPADGPSGGEGDSPLGGEDGGLAGGDTLADTGPGDNGFNDGPLSDAGFGGDSFGTVGDRTAAADGRGNGGVDGPAANGGDAGPVAEAAVAAVADNLVQAIDSMNAADIPVAEQKQVFAKLGGEAVVKSLSNSDNPVARNVGALLSQVRQGQGVDFNQMKNLLQSQGVEKDTMMTYLAAQQVVQKEARTAQFSGALSQLRSGDVKNPFGQFTDGGGTDDATAPKLGKYVAILIGVEKYGGKIPDLNTPIGDIKAMSDVLQKRFGYDTVMLPDASHDDIVKTLQRVGGSLRPDQSLMVYYAGHGYTQTDTGVGYWLPRDASSGSADKWISTADLSGYLSQVKSNQIMVISDSCYSGNLTKEHRVETAAKDAPLTDVADKRSVLVMSSGGEEPVYDDGYPGHSVFAGNLIEALENVPDDQRISSLFATVRDKVAENVPQTPTMGALLSAGHEVGG